ncbi:uncharacterized protein [Choristoneura fumiferana]|uniref:uncharacterized protein n=1 Tax=Choristoneura fumiferana TaxID=7141 RepID=UPI003D154F03
MNTHHLLWSYKTDTKGEKLYKAMFEHNYICLNNGAHTRIRLADGQLQQSSPDVTFASTDISLKCTWMVSNESLGSDHLIIKLKFGYEKSKTPILRRNFKKADWKQYTDKTGSFFDNQQWSLNVQQIMTHFVRGVNTAADTSIPWIKQSQDPTNKFSPKSYWCPEISEAVAQRRLALKYFRRNPTPSNFSTLQIKSQKLDN